jgi:hypothetical protein
MTVVITGAWQAASQGYKKTWARSTGDSHCTSPAPGARCHLWQRARSCTLLPLLRPLRPLSPLCPAPLQPLPLTPTAAMACHLLPPLHLRLLLLLVAWPLLLLLRWLLLRWVLLIQPPLPPLLPLLLLQRAGLTTGGLLSAPVAARAGSGPVPGGGLQHLQE